MSAIKNYLDKFGSNFIVASTIPSFAFVLACIIVFGFKETTDFESVLAFFTGFSSWPELLGVNLFLFVPTMIIGFTLTTLNTHILKLFEGYVFFNHFSFLVKRQKKKANELSLKRERLKRRIERLKQREKKLTNGKYIRKRKSNLEKQYYQVAANYDASFPPSVDLVLPTKFGNILRSAESYSGTRYGIDAVLFWPRLFFVIHDDYKKVINESRDELSFLVNCSVLASTFFVICVGYALCEFNQVENRFLLASVISLVLAWFFNRASLISVRAFGDTIRSAYDLFRLDLLKQLRLKMPKNSYEEYKNWRNLGEFIVLGNASLGFDALIYDHPKDAQSDTH